MTPLRLVLLSGRTGPGGHQGFASLSGFPGFPGFPGSYDRQHVSAERDHRFKVGTFLDIDLSIER
jgi:hypothetical protein